MLAIFINCICRFPNEMEGIDPELLPFVRTACSQQVCRSPSCNEGLINGEAYIGEWNEDQTEVKELFTEE